MWMNVAQAVAAASLAQCGALASPAISVAATSAAFLLVAEQLRKDGGTQSNVHAFTRVGGGRNGTLIVQCVLVGLWLTINLCLWAASLTMVQPVYFVCFGVAQSLVQHSAPRKSAAVCTAVALLLACWSAIPLQGDAERTTTSVGGVVTMLCAFISEFARRSFVRVLCHRAKSDDENTTDNERVAAFVNVATYQFAAAWSIVTLFVLQWTVEGPSGFTDWSSYATAFVIAVNTIDGNSTVLPRCLLAILSLGLRVMFCGVGGVCDVTALLSIFCSGAAFVLNKQPFTSASSTEMDPSALFGSQWNLMQTIYSSPKSRKLLTFLALNFAFMVVELVTGVHANSLGLISDAIHMLMDSMSVAIGLYAAVMALVPATEVHPFGRARFEVISAFVNGILLLLVACGTLMEAIHRIYTPRTVNGLSLLPVSIGGLIVNLVGVAFFHEAHGHSHSHSCDTHAECSHEHSHHSHSEGSDSNLRGVYLHIVADLLGSVSVICSSLIIYFTGFSRADSICSLGVVCIVAFASKSLIVESGSILLMKSPQSSTENEVVRQRLTAIPDVKSVPSLLSWINAPSGSDLAVHCMAVVEVASLTNIDLIRAEVSRIIIDAGCASSIDALTIEFT